MSSLCKLTLASKEKFDARQLEALVLMICDSFDEVDSGQGDIMLEEKVQEKVEAVYRARQMDIHSAKSVQNPDPPILLASRPMRDTPRW